MPLKGPASVVLRGEPSRPTNEMQIRLHVAHAEGQVVRLRA